MKTKQPGAATQEQIVRRFKILYLLASHMNIWERQMAELADKMDQGHPLAEEALTFYEDKIIETLEAK